MGLKASTHKKDSGFHTNWDQNFVSIGVHELHDDEFDGYNIIFTHPCLWPDWMEGKRRGVE